MQTVVLLSDYSTTNVQREGVDEGDIVKRTANRYIQSITLIC